MKPGAFFPISYINETGNFQVIDYKDQKVREEQALTSLVKSNPMITIRELCEATGLKVYTVRETLKRLGWHMIKGGPEGHFPWHQDMGQPCPYATPGRGSKAVDFDAPEKEEEKPKVTVQDAVAYLSELLAGTTPNGEYVPEQDVFQEADERGISDSLIAKARKRLGVVIKNEKGTKAWSLPEIQEDDHA
jgi:hypothetical protein